jgi:hypothetical protein
MENKKEIIIRVKDNEKFLEDLKNIVKVNEENIIKILVEINVKNKINNKIYRITRTIEKENFIKNIIQELEFTKSPYIEYETFIRKETFIKEEIEINLIRILIK